jgi:hypothetical protein
LPQFLEALVLTALDENGDVLASNEELASGDRPDTTKELDLHHLQKLVL